MSTALGELGAATKYAFSTGPFGSSISAKYFRNVGVPVLRGSNLSTDVGRRLVEDDLAFIDEELARSFARSVAARGDLVFTCWGTIGQIGIIDDSSGFQRYVVSNKQMKMTPDRSRVDSLWLYYYLSQPRMLSYVADQSIGSSVPGFNLGQLKQLPIELPALATQRAIAEVLAALDDKIAANRKVAAQSRDLAATMVSAVAERVPLAELAEASRATLSPSAFGPGPVLHFSLPACDVGVPELAADPSDIKSAKFKLTEPCVLVSKLNPRIPRIWDVPSLADMLCLSSTEFVVLTPRDGETSVLAAALDDPRFSIALQGKVAGTSGSHQRVKPAELLATEIADITTLSPATAGAISVLGKQRASIVKENEQLAATRDSLLPLLMSGKLRVKDAEKQVGEVV